MMQSPEEPLKGILVGCGFMGGIHAQVYKVLPDVEIVAAVDTRAEPSAEKLKSLGCPAPVHTTLEEALAKHSCHFVDICLPTHLHEEFAVQAIRAGKALFCEKPLALNMKQADKILSAAQEHGTLAQVGHCIRFWPEYQALMEYHRNGRGGKLSSLHLLRRGGRPDYAIDDWLNDPSLSGGAALDLHIHDTDFVLALLGPPKSFKSRVTEDFSGPVHIFTLMEFDSLTVSTEGGWNYPPQWGFQMAFQAVYQNAALDFDSSNSKGLVVTEGNSAPRRMEVAGPELEQSTSREGNISDLGGYYNQLKYFTDRIRQGKAPATATLEDAYASLELTLREIQEGKGSNAKC